MSEEPQDFLSALHGGADTNKQESKSSADGEQDVTMPLSAMTGSDDLPQIGDGELQSVQSTSKLTSPGTLIVIAVAAVAIGAIYVMRQAGIETTQDAQAVTVQTKLEQALMQLSKSGMSQTNPALSPDKLKSLFADTDDVLATFSHDAASSQVPLEFVQKDPFVLYRPPVKQTPEILPDPDALADKRAREEALKAMKKLQNELSKLELSTIMTGDPSMAMINGEFVKPGSTIGSFVIKRIDADKVLLEALGTEFELRMDGGFDISESSLFRK